MRKLKAATVASSAPADELARLVAKRAGLETRKAALDAAAEKEVEARRELLIEGADAAAIGQAERACREAESAALATADALAEVERRIAVAEEQRAVAAADARRETAATDLERSAQAIEAAADNARRVVQDLMRAHKALAAAIIPTAAPLFAKWDHTGLRSGESPKVIAAHVIGHLINTGMPGVLEASEAGRQGSYGWISAIAIKAEQGEAPERPLLIEPIRELVERVRAGEVGPDLPRYQRPEPDFRPTVPERQIYLIEPFRYQTRTGSAFVPVSTSITHVPEPVADRAIELGYASYTKPQGFARIEQTLSHLARTGININSFHDIDFDMERWADDEAERRREAWLAEQSEVAA